MGFFDFLKRKPEKKEEKITYNLSFLELKPWITNYSKNLTLKTNEEIAQILNNIKEAKTKLKLSLHELEKAEPRNKNIPERAMQLMKGNREMYSRHLGHFMASLDKPKKEESLKDFYQSFDKRISTLQKTTKKSHHVMEEFFPKESSALTLGIQEIDKSMRRIKEIIGERKTEELEALTRSAEHFQEYITQKKDLSTNITSIKSKIQSTESSISSLETELSQQQKSQEYLDFINIENQQKELEKSLSNENQKMLQFFSSVNHSLKKYINLNPEDGFAIEYLNNPINTLLGDKDFEVLKLISQIKNNIIMNKIELKDKKKTKTLTELENIDKKFFENFLKTHHTLKKQIEDVRKQANEIQITVTLDKLKIDIERNKEALHVLNTDHDKTLNKAKRINIIELKDNLEKQIQEGLDEDVKVSVS